MSVLCQKDYSITIASAFPQPNRYWKCNDLVANVTSPSIGALGITTVDCALVAGSGLIGGTNAIRFGSFPLTKAETNQTDFYLPSYANGWTLRWWVRNNASDIGQMNLYSRNPGGTYDWNTESVGGVGNYRGHFFEAVTFNDVLVPTTYPVDTGWHRILLQYNPVAKSVSLKIDDQATATTTDPAGLFFNPSPEFLRWPAIGTFPARTLLFCEIGLWLNTLLTEPEMHTDWNGGAGQTFP